jgi:hypothetical protein
MQRRGGRLKAPFPLRRQQVAREMEKVREQAALKTRKNHIPEHLSMISPAYTSVRNERFSAKEDAHSSRSENTSRA